MPDDALLIGIATIAVAVAGFTAVTSTLTPPGGSWSLQMRIRQRAIVSTSFNVVYEALVPLIAVAWFSDVRTALVISSAAVAVYAAGIVVWRFRQLIRAGGPRNRSLLFLYAAGPTATLLFAVNALGPASVAVYALALCIQLSVAVISFYSLVAAAQG